MVVWAQEEPKNMGFWGYMEPRLRTVFTHLQQQRHLQEQEQEQEQERLRVDGFSDRTDTDSLDNLDDPIFTDRKSGRTRTGPYSDNPGNYTYALKYVGRPPAASPATGSFEVHQFEMKRLVAEVFEA